MKKLEALRRAYVKKFGVQMVAQTVRSHMVEKRHDHPEHFAPLCYICKWRLS